MNERIWSGQSPLWRLLLPLSLLYGLVSRLIRLGYQAGLRKSWRAPVPVVVVGNLTAGGSGKTPLVIWLVEQLQQRAIRVGVVSRGYGGSAPHYPFLVTADSSAAQCGDEPLLIFQRTGVPLAVGANRRAAIQQLLQHYPLDLIITDDGLQHYALQRDREIVVIDGVRRFGNGWWLPAGPMRERASRLQQVHAIICNGGTARAGEIAMQLQPDMAVNLATGQRCPPEALPPVVALAGIGNPPRFFATLHQLGIQPERCVALADHQTLSAERLRQLTSAKQQLLMTEKDAVKYRASAQKHWWYLPVSAQLHSPAARQLLDDIATLAHQRAP